MRVPTLAGGGIREVANAANAIANPNRSSGHGRLDYLYPAGLTRTWSSTNCDDSPRSTRPSDGAPEPEFSCRIRASLPRIAR